MDRNEEAEGQGNNVSGAGDCWCCKCNGPSPEQGQESMGVKIKSLICSVGVRTGPVGLFCLTR